MIDNTLENKAKFFALYWGQEIVGWNFSAGGHSSMRLTVDDIRLNSNQKEFFLELKPLYQISDEDFLEIMCMLFPFQPKSSFRKDSIYLDHLNINQVDYLRSKDYALPFMGTSVDTLIQYGWVKFKEANNASN